MRQKGVEINAILLDSTSSNLKSGSRDPYFNIPYIVIGSDNYNRTFLSSDTDFTVITRGRSDLPGLVKVNETRPYVFKKMQYGKN